jgi:hypothetical protein
MRRQDGQMLPLLIFALLAAMWLGIAVFNVGRAAVLRSETQTAADAAALAGARNIRQQLQAQFAATGQTNLALVNYALVRVAMTDYARRNGADLVKTDFRGVDVKAWVRDRAKVGKRGRPFESEDQRATAKARARIEIAFSYAGGGIGGLPSGVPGVGGGGGGGGVPKFDDEDFKRLQEEIGPGPPDCKDIIKLGHFLQRRGFAVGENAYFGGIQGGHAPGGYHYKCENAGALDVNYGGPGDLVPAEVAAVDPIIGPLNDLGFRTIWRAPGHYNHLHVDIGNSGPIGGGSGFGGIGGPLEDALMAVRLIDWNAAYAPFYGFGGVGAGGFYGGPPDEGVARAICRVLDRHEASPKVRLAAFEAAIVESGVHNLNYGDRDSLGAFQQRPSMGWGTPAQILNPEYAATQFVTRAISANRDYMSAGQLAQAVQRSAYPERYDQRASQANALLEKFCG